MTIHNYLQDCIFDKTDLSLKDQLCILIYQYANKLSRFYGALLTPHGLTFPQYQVLIVLWDKGASTIGAICTALALDTSTITPVVKRLEALGYVTRFRDRVDERKVFVSLTERGMEFKKDAQLLRCRLINELELSHDDFLEAQRVLRRLMSSINRVLDQQPSKRTTG